MANQNAKKLTLADVNNELARMGNGHRLVKGKGYFYFDGPGTESWPSTSVMVFSVSHLSLGGWIEAYEEKLKDGSESEDDRRKRADIEYMTGRGRPI
jgi:hypothetical protein